MDKLTHLDERGNAHMVDVSSKNVTDRVAVAKAKITMKPETLNKIIDGLVPKGDVLAVARISGIMAAKETSNLIPMCHPISLSSVKLNLEQDIKLSCINIKATCKVNGQTGVEMEALTAASVAALTIYDMCKSVDRGMIISDIKLVHKAGGKSGTWDTEKE